MIEKIDNLDDLQKIAKRIFSMRNDVEAILSVQEKLSNLVKEYLASMNLETFMEKPREWNDEWYGISFKTTKTAAVFMQKEALDFILQKEGKPSDFFENQDRQNLTIISPGGERSREKKVVSDDNRIHIIDSVLAMTRYAPPDIIEETRKELETALKIINGGYDG